MTRGSANRKASTNLRPIAPGDPDFARLYPRRNDAESINRDLDDTLYLRPDPTCEPGFVPPAAAPTGRTPPWAPLL